MANGISLRLKGPWRGAIDALDPVKFRKRVEEKISKLLQQQAKLLQRQARTMAGLAANQPMTTFIKGRDEPGVDTGNLRSAIRVVSFGKLTWWVGVEKRNDAYASAVLLTKGGIIPVTDDMRAMFTMLWAVSEGRAKPEALTGRAAELWAKRPGGWLPLKPETTHLVIVGRPFMQEAWRDVQLSYDLAGKIQKTIAAALTEPARRKGSKK